MMWLLLSRVQKCNLNSSQAFECWDNNPLNYQVDYQFSLISPSLKSELFFQRALEYLPAILNSAMKNCFSSVNQPNSLQSCAETNRNQDRWILIARLKEVPWSSSLCDYQSIPWEFKRSSVLNLQLIRLEYCLL